jgi:glutaminyl-tRNA synthetase
MLEPSMAAAERGSRWQLERVGYFVVDAEDSKPGALVLNRIIGLRDSWQTAAEPAAADEPIHQRSAKSKTRPPKRSRVEYRAEARARDAELAERYARWPSEHGISEADADLLTGDRVTSDLFASALGAGAEAVAVARWIVNEVGDRELGESPLTGEALAKLVTAVERGSITGAVAKHVFTEMLEHGGDPERIVAERGLAQVDDEAAIAAMVDEALAGDPDKVAQYREGKTALLGFFMGQVVKASNGKANPQVVREVLAERLS